MNNIKRINYDDMTILFVTDYWDLPLSGYCEYENELYEFNIDRDSLDAVYRSFPDDENDQIDEDEYERQVEQSWHLLHVFIKKLTREQRIRYKMYKMGYELFFGKDWSYVNGERCEHKDNRPKIVRYALHSIGSIIYHFYHNIQYNDHKKHNIVHILKQLKRVYCG